MSFLNRLSIKTLECQSYTTNSFRSLNYFLPADWTRKDSSIVSVYKSYIKSNHVELYKHVSGKYKSQKLWFSNLLIGH